MAVSGVNNTTRTNTDNPFKNGASAAKTGMETEDFLKLIMAQYQNQDIMNPASSDDFVNQMVQLMTIQTMTTLNDISTISYAASLVGKEVTLGIRDSNSYTEIVGTVTGTGQLDGEQVIFVNGKSYALNSIMAVGRIPEEKDDAGADKVEKPNEGTDATEKPSEPASPDEKDPEAGEESA